MLLNVYYFCINKKKAFELCISPFDQLCKCNLYHLNLSIHNYECGSLCLGIFQYYYALKAATEGYLFYPKMSTVILQKNKKKWKKLKMFAWVKWGLIFLLTLYGKQITPVNFENRTKQYSDRHEWWWRDYGHQRRKFFRKNKMDEFL